MINLLIVSVAVVRLVGVWAGHLPILSPDWQGISRDKFEDILNRLTFQLMDFGPCIDGGYARMGAQPSAL